MKIELNKSEVEYIVSGLEELCESDLEENEYRYVEVKAIRKWIGEKFLA